MTGVSPDVWAEWGARAIATAYEVLDRIYRNKAPREPQGYGEDAPQMSG